MEIAAREKAAQGPTQGPTDLPPQPGAAATDDVQAPRPVGAAGAAAPARHRHAIRLLRDERGFAGRRSNGGGFRFDDQNPVITTAKAAAPVMVARGHHHPRTAPIPSNRQCRGYKAVGGDLLAHRGRHSRGNGGGQLVPGEGPPGPVGRAGGWRRRGRQRWFQMFPNQCRNLAPKGERTGLKKV
jgi:hypothetical protein